VRRGKRIALGLSAVAVTGVALVSAPMIAAHAAPAPSTNFAGYSGSLPAASTLSERMKLTVPAVSCPSSGSAAFNVIFDVFGSKGFQYGNLIVDCSGGVASYNASIGGPGRCRTTGSSCNFNVAAGDVLQYSLSSSGTTKSSSSLKDVTTNFEVRYGGAGIGASSLQSATSRATAPPRFPSSPR
jgi:hypothetical protein